MSVYAPEPAVPANENPEDEPAGAAPLPPVAPAPPNSEGFAALLPPPAAGFPNENAPPDPPCEGADVLGVFPKRLGLLAAGVLEAPPPNKLLEPVLPPPLPKRLGFEPDVALVLFAPPKRDGAPVTGVVELNGDLFGVAPLAPPKLNPPDMIAVYRGVCVCTAGLLCAGRRARVKRRSRGGAVNGLSRPISLRANRGRSHRLCGRNVGGESQWTRQQLAASATGARCCCSQILGCLGGATANSSAGPSSAVVPSRFQTFDPRRWRLVRETNNSSLCGVCYLLHGASEIPLIALSPSIHCSLPYTTSLCTSREHLELDIACIHTAQLPLNRAQHGG